MKQPKEITQHKKINRKIRRYKYAGLQFQEWKKEKKKTEIKMLEEKKAESLNMRTKRRNNKNIYIEN